MNSLNNRDARNTIVQTYLKMLMAQGLSEEEAKKQVPNICPGHLRLELDMTTANAQYQFGVLNNDSPVAKNTEIRLNSTDNFHVVAAGLWIAVPATATAATYRCYSYANPQVFTGGAAGAGGGGDILFNNSQLKVLVNNVLYINAFSTSAFQRRGVSQELAGFGKSVTAASDLLSTMQDEWVGDEYGYTDLGVIFKLGGRDTNIITITMPTAPPAIIANQRMILILRGFYAQNATLGQ